VSYPEPRHPAAPLRTCEQRDSPSSLPAGAVRSSSTARSGPGSPRTGAGRRIGAWRAPWTLRPCGP